MKANYKNIGLIATAEIELNGITVVAAPNNSGKSTISKTLYMFLETMVNFQEEYTFFRNETIAENISRFCRLLYRTLTSQEMEELVIDFNNQIKENEIEPFLRIEFDEESGTIESSFPWRMFEVDVAEESDLRRNIEILKRAYSKFSTDDKNWELLDEVQSYFEYSQGKKLELVLKAKIRSYFDNDLISHESDGEAYFGLFDNQSLFDNLNIIHAKFNNDNIVDLESQVSLNEFSKILYLDSFINLENYNFTRYPRFLRVSRDDIRTKSDGTFRSLIDPKQEINPFRGDLSDQDKLFNYINQIIGGNVEQQSGKIVYSKDDYQYNLKNTATGIKIFGALQLLLKNYQMTPEMFMIIDEPETNLHPVWQVKLAEAIVLLNRDLGVQFMINSHSANFIEGIKLYSELYENEGATKFYLINTEQYGRHTVQDISGNIQLAYDQLNGSLDLLDEVAEQILQKSQGETDEN